MKKILIVDDEPNIIMSLEYTFRKNNFEVFIARDGQEALDILEKESKPQALTDIRDRIPLAEAVAVLVSKSNFNTVEVYKIITICISSTPYFNIMITNS